MADCIGMLDRTAPERIWLQVDIDVNRQDRDEMWPGDAGVTWCSESIGGLEVMYVRADLANAAGWQPIATAPHDQRILVWTGQERYCAHWVQNPHTGDEAWLIAVLDEDGNQALVKPTHWMPLQDAPHG